jgi:hypothetical protein
MDKKIFSPAYVFMLVGLLSSILVHYAKRAFWISTKLFEYDFPLLCTYLSKVQVDKLTNFQAKIFFRFGDQIVKFIL